MLRLFLIFITFLLVTICYSQQSAKDSIQQIINTIPLEQQQDKVVDSVIIKQLRNHNNSLLIHYVDSIIDTSKKQGNQERLAKMYLQKAFVLRQRAVVDSAFQLIETALSIANAQNNAQLKLQATTAKAHTYEAQGDYAKAIEQYLKTIAYYDAHGMENSRDKLIDIYNLAGAYTYIGDFDKSLEANKQLYEHPQIKADVDFLNEVIVNYAGVALYTKNYKLAEKLLTEADKTETRNIFKGQIALLLSALYQETENYDESLQYYDVASALFLESGDVLRHQTLQINKGMLYLKLGRLDKAENLFKEIERNSKEKQTSHPEINQALYDGLAILYDRQGAYKKALLYTTKKYELNDSLKGLEKQNYINELEIKYETEKTKREREKAQQEAAIATLESTRNRNLFISSILVAVLVIASILFYVSRARAKKKAEIVTLELRQTQKRLALEKQYRDSELKALKAQMNPHFIFNALNSIQEYIILNQKNLAGNYLGKFADLMRKYLHHSDAGYITINEEIESLEMYLELESLRFEDTLNYTITLDPAIQAEFTKIPTMLIQPYVENALKHGLLHKEQDKKITITFNKSKEHILSCTIIDNGIGREASQKMKENLLKSRASFATKATESRLKLLNFGRDKKIGVTIIDLKTQQNTPAGTKVILEIPITK